MKVPYGYLSRQFTPEVAERIWVERVKKVVTTGDFTLGEEVREFERRFAKLMGTKYCLGVANGTDALELAIWAYNLPPGSEIIVPVNTFVASAASIVTAGHAPVFVDTNENLVIAEDMIEQKITDKTAAILPVHFGGQPCNMAKIMKIAKKHELLVIEDAAQAADAVSNAGPCGSVGDIGCVSFHPQKNLNAWGDGGAIVTNDKEAYDKLMLYRNHGMLDRDTYAFASRNSRLDSVHAAVLNYFMPYLHADNYRRIEIAKQYNKAFRGFAWLPESELDEHITYHLYMMRLHEPELRNDLMRHLQYFGVDARIHYPKPLHMQEAFAYLGHKEGNFPNAEAQAKAIISLPIHQYMINIEVDYVIKCVTDFFT